MNILNKLIALSCIGSCVSYTSNSESPDLETIYDICFDIKQIYCSKLFECNDISVDYCMIMASADTRCEDSGASNEELLQCKNLLLESTCSTGVPEYCKQLQKEKD